MTKVTTPRVRESRTAFVLSGGGNQGVSQVGMLRALLERGIRPDVVVGTSVGALNGAVVATLPEIHQIDHLEEVWTRLTSEAIFPGGTLRRAWNLLRRDDHLIPNSGMRALIENALVPDAFSDLAVPLRVVTADLDSGSEMVFASGPLRPALLASSALPGIFPPVPHGGGTLVDGAVVNLVPISHALAGPVDRIFVLDVSDPMGERPLRSPLDVVVEGAVGLSPRAADLEGPVLDPVGSGDQEIVGETHEEPVLHDPGPGLEERRQPGHVVDRTEVGVEDPVALVGEERVGADGSEHDLRAEREHLHGNVAPGAQPG